MSKAAEAFRTISEVAAELEVQKHVLRFWEAKFPQIRPMKRGGGRRYYRPEDMELLRGIRHLLHAEGYTIKGVQKILREQGIDHVKQFGRAIQPAPAPPVPRAKRSRRIAQAAPGTKGPQGTPSTGRDARSQGTIGLAGKALLEAAISELENCRKVLLEVAGPSQGSRGARRARAQRV
jgi:DNA-binding transcriptional MerR regulator